ncbi:MAG: hypothetical protein ACFE9T_06075 [Promethearchaeota archaeon]
MKINNKQIFKIFFFAGLILLFISLFLDWYTYQVFDINDNLISSWSYNMLIEWHTNLSEYFTLNEVFRPNNLNVSPFLHFMFIIIIILCGFITLTKDAEQAKTPQKFRNYAFINLFLLLLIGFYIMVFPMIYLCPNELYFPYFMYEDLDTNITYVYSLNIGYYFQVVAFIFTFPYAIFYYQTITHFAKDENTPEEVISKFIETKQEYLDLDKFIAEEELKHHIKGAKRDPEREIDHIYNKSIPKRFKK